MLPQAPRRSWPCSSASQEASHLCGRPRHNSGHSLDDSKQNCLYSGGKLRVGTLALVAGSGKFTTEACAAPKTLSTDGSGSSLLL